MKMLETKAKCIDSTYSMTFLIVRITKHWSNTLLKLKYRICHVKREKNQFESQFCIWDLGIYLGLRTVAFICTRICTVLSR